MTRSITAAGVGMLLLASVSAGMADDGWNPFKNDDARTGRAGREAREPGLQPAPQAEPLPQMGGLTRPWATPGAAGAPGGDAAGTLPPADDRIVPWGGPAATAGRPGAGRPGEDVQRAPISEAVQRSELAPVAAADGSGLPAGLWQGSDATQLQELIAPLRIPPPSAALASLWRRMWTSDAAASGSPSLSAVRIEALYRSGHLDELARVLKSTASDGGDPVLGLLTARVRILVGDREQGCGGIKAMQRGASGLPKAARAEFLELAAYCGASGRDAGAAGLAAELLRAEGVKAPLALAVLDTLSAGATGTFRAPEQQRLGLLDYRFLELAGAGLPREALGQAEPALLAAVAAGALDSATRIAAAEAATMVHALGASELATAYRAVEFGPAAMAEPLAERLDPPLKRALLLKALEAERTPARKAKLARAFLDETRRARGPYLAAAALLATAIDDFRPQIELGWFAETAIEIEIAAGRYERARRWADPPAGERHAAMGYWLALADIADPAMRGRRGESLGAVEQLAVRGRLAPELMHRLVTVLDALDYQIPIPLWEAASRTPQPATGHLPETGVLSQLQEASKRKELARTMLLVMRTLGPDTGETAHMIALGDAIRALKRAGLEADARRLGLEALFAGWPRATSH